MAAAFAALREALSPSLGDGHFCWHRGVAPRRSAPAPADFVIGVWTAQRLPWQQQLDSFALASGSCSAPPFTDSILFSNMGMEVL